jgi:hypothetical protein
MLSLSELRMHPALLRRLHQDPRAQLLLGNVAVCEWALHDPFVNTFQLPVIRIFLDDSLCTISSISAACSASISCVSWRCSPINLVLISRVAWACLASRDVFNLRVSERPFLLFLPCANKLTGWIPVLSDPSLATVRHGWNLSRMTSGERTYYWHTCVEKCEMIDYR